MFFSAPVASSSAESPTAIWAPGPACGAAAVAVSSSSRLTACRTASLGRPTSVGSIAAPGVPREAPRELGRRNRGEAAERCQPERSPCGRRGHERSAGDPLGRATARDPQRLGGVGLEGRVHGRDARDDEVADRRPLGERGTTRRAVCRLRRCQSGTPRAGPTRCRRSLLGHEIRTSVVPRQYARVYAVRQHLRARA